MADIKISEMTSASIVNDSDNIELSQSDGVGGFASFKASILAIANRIVSGISFTSALQTTNKTITGAINEVAQGGGGSGGHTILDDDGTALSQEDNLQFVGVYSEDDSVNDTTKVNIVREMTQAQYDLLSADEKKGIIRITDKNYVCEASEVKFGSGNVEAEVEKKMDWVSNGVLGAKNLNSYPYYHTSRSTSGIDWTDNGDGTWTAKGLASSNSAAYCHNRVHPSDRELFLPNGNYIICGCPSGGGDAAYSINIDITTNGSNNNLARDYGDGATFTISGDDFSNDGAYVRVSCTVYSGYDCGTTDGIIFKPMILLDKDTDYTWTPYAMTNKEITDVVNNVPLTAGTYSLQAVRNADGTITYSWV